MYVIICLAHVPAAAAKIKCCQREFCITGATPVMFLCYKCDVVVKLQHVSVLQCCICNGWKLLDRSGC
jgi:hypothetical protein